MSAALPQLVAGYVKKTAQAVKLLFGASGNLTNQTANGALFDVFFSAAEDYPQQLIAEGAAKETFYRSAVGRLVLWVPAESPLDLSKLGMKALLDPSVEEISIANPQLRHTGGQPKRRYSTLQSAIRFPAVWLSEKTFRRRRNSSNRATPRRDSSRCLMLSLPR
jgi:molybdenum ABC transporter molybdate-binding protein